MILSEIVEVGVEAHQIWMLVQCWKDGIMGLQSLEQTRAKHLNQVASSDLPPDILPHFAAFSYVRFTLENRGWWYVRGGKKLNKC